MDVHRAGGGIHFTVRHVQAASEHQLATDFIHYAQRMTEAGEQRLLYVTHPRLVRIVFFLCARSFQKLNKPVLYLSTKF